VKGCRGVHALSDHGSCGRASNLTRARARAAGRFQHTRPAASRAIFFFRRRLGTLRRSCFNELVSCSSSRRYG
jgi:hypothetical protein